MPERDSRWVSIVGLDNWQDFKELSDSFQLDSKVSNVICIKFKLTQKLINYSYYEYEFMDAAFSSALICFEFALKNRLTELISEDLSENDLGKLIDIAAKRSLFDIDKDRVHSLREMRNDIMHTDRYQMYGFAALNGISIIVELINGLYEDVENRIERKRIIRSTNNKLKNLFKNGANLKSDQGSHIFFDLELLYFNNKQYPAIYTFCFYPIFSIPDTTKVYQIGEPYIVKSSHFEVINDKFIIENESNKITLSQLKEAEIVIVSEWKKNIIDNYPAIWQIIVMRKNDFLNQAKFEKS